MKNKAAVFIMLGQSNAVGHGIPMEEKDIIKTPLKNVFGLLRSDNQSFDIEKLKWSGYLSGGMNLGETQDNTYSLVNQLAKVWQNKIDEGADLPDLYIIQIAIGAEAVTEKYKWYPKREKKLIPGPLGICDISLYPFSCHIFSLLDKSFKEMNKEYEIIGLHWRGGSNDVTENSEDLKLKLYSIYDEIFSGFNKILNNPSIFIHRLFIKERCFDCVSTGEYYKSMNVINATFTKLSENFENISIYDISKYPHYDPNVRCYGLYIEDAVHFTPEVNLWAATEIIREYSERHNYGL